MGLGGLTLTLVELETHHAPEDEPPSTVRLFVNVLTAPLIYRRLPIFFSPLPLEKEQFAEGRLP